MIQESIKDRIQKLGLTQKKVCDDLGLIAQNFNGYLKGSRAIPFETLSSLMTYLRLGLFEPVSKTYTAMKNAQFIIKDKVDNEKLKLKDIAAKACVDQSTISSFLNGHRDISAKSFESILIALEFQIKPFNPLFDKYDE